MLPQNPLKQSSLRTSFIPIYIYITNYEAISELVLGDALVKGGKRSSSLAA